MSGLSLDGIKGIIFDIDGTILDSMGIWDTLCSDYLKKTGITPDDNIDTIVAGMTVKECIPFIKEKYQIDKSCETIGKEVNEMIANFYFYEVEAKPGVLSLIRNFHRKGIPMVLATTGETILAQKALERVGVWKYFDKFFSCEDYDTNKSQPLVYNLAVDTISQIRGEKVETNEVYVFEDAPAAINTVAEMGFKVIGIYDETAVAKGDVIGSDVSTDTDISLKCYKYISDYRELMKYTALTIAGSDSSGGAGIQADLKTMCAHDVYGMTAITALTAQNTTGVTDVLEVSPKFLRKQIDAVFEDIFPDGVKIGMLANADIVRTVAKALADYQPENVVVDPVMVATSGSVLTKEDTISVMIDELFPRASLLTPNIPEAEALTGMTINSAEDMEKAATKIYEMVNLHKAILCKQKDTAILLKGGHSINDANDLLVTKDGICWIKGERITTANTHGTGCTLSSAICSNLIMGYDILTAVTNAKKYLEGALKGAYARTEGLGRGSGPVDHMYALR